jgi:hypothetical protein
MDTPRAEFTEGSSSPRRSGLPWVSIGTKVKARATREPVRCQKQEGGPYCVGSGLRGDQIIRAGNERQAQWACNLARAVCGLADSNGARRRLHWKDLGRIGRNVDGSSLRRHGGGRESQARSTKPAVDAGGVLGERLDHLTSVTRSWQITRARLCRGTAVYAALSKP